MGKWRITKVTDEYRELVNTETGSVRKVPFASDKQWNYLESLREQTASPGKYKRLKNRPLAYQASKAIDKCLAKLNQQTLV